MTRFIIEQAACRRVESNVTSYAQRGARLVTLRTSGSASARITCERGVQTTPPMPLGALAASAFIPHTRLPCVP